MRNEAGYPPYKKNDLVQVISGKYKGKKGKVLKLIKDKHLILVEKINVVKRHTKPSQKDPKGGIIEKEAPLHVSKVLPLSLKSNKPVRVSVWLKESEKPAKKAKQVKKTRGEK